MKRTIHLRLTEDEYAAIQQAAFHAEVSLTEWQRSVVLGALKETPAERRQARLLRITEARLMAAMIEWQMGHLLTNEDVKTRILRSAGATA